MNERGRRQFSDGVRNAVDIVQIERQMIERGMVERYRPTADPVTRQPSRNRRSTIAAPIPELAPVTSA
jgi:hypothetical protein